MSQRFQPSDELIELLQATVDEELAASEHHRLEELISGDAEARAFFAEFLQLHATLSHQAVGLGIEQLATGSWSVEGPAPSVNASHVIAGSTSARPRFPKRSSIALLAAVAALLILAIALPKYLPFGEGAIVPQEAGSFANSSVAETEETTPISRPPAPVATLASHENAQWGDGPLAVGQLFHEGETIKLEQGKARISVGFGAEIAADAPCHLTFIARDRVRLDRGEIVVDVAPWATGFTVVTDEMDVVDLGTTFSVSAFRGATVETKVLSGFVRAIPAKTRSHQQRSVLLSEGEGLFVDDLGNRRAFEQIPADILSKFTFGTLAQYRPVELHNTGLGLAEGDQDPHWRVVAGPEGAFEGPQFAQVCVPHERYLVNDPEESQWVSLLNWAKSSPNSTYTFQTTFDLTGYDLSTMRIFGRFLADNGIQDVRVNGRQVPIESWADNLDGQRFDDSQFRFVNVTEGLREGENVIEIDVWNGTQSDGMGEQVAIPNHMSLRAEWYAFGRQMKLVDNREAILDRSR